MRKGFALISLMFMFLASFSYAHDLDISLYTMKDGEKSFGNINVNPGDKITAYILAENTNTHTSDEDQEIEDIEIDAVIERLDDEDDEEFDFDSFDLKPKKKQTLEFPIEVPLQIEDGSHEITIEYTGSQDGEEFSDDTTFTLMVKKAAHRINLTRLSFSKKEVQCGFDTSVLVDAINLGTNDETATISAINKELGISVSKEFEVEMYPEDDTYSTSLQILTPKKIMTGNYPIDIEVKYSGIVDKYTATLKINCIEPVPQSTQNPITNANTGKNTESHIEDTQEQTETKQTINPVQETDADKTSQIDATQTPIVKENTNKRAIVLISIVGICIILLIVIAIILAKRK